MRASGIEIYFGTLRHLPQRIQVVKETLEKESKCATTVTIFYKDSSG